MITKDKALGNTGQFSFSIYLFCSFYIEILGSNIDKRLDISANRDVVQCSVENLMGTA